MATDEPVLLDVTKHVITTSETLNPKLKADGLGPTELAFIILSLDVGQPHHLRVVRHERTGKFLIRILGRDSIVETSIDTVANIIYTIKYQVSIGVTFDKTLSDKEAEMLSSLVSEDYMRVERQIRELRRNQSPDTSDEDCDENKVVPLEDEPEAVDEQVAEKVAEIDPPIQEEIKFYMRFRYQSDWQEKGVDLSLLTTIGFNQICYNTEKYQSDCAVKVFRDTKTHFWVVEVPLTFIVFEASQSLCHFVFDLKEALLKKSIYPRINFSAKLTDEEFEAVSDIVDEKQLAIELHIRNLQPQPAPIVITEPSTPQQIPDEEVFFTGWKPNIDVPATRMSLSSILAYLDSVIIDKSKRTTYQSLYWNRVLRVDFMVVTEYKPVLSFNFMRLSDFKVFLAAIRKRDPSYILSFDSIKPDTTEDQLKNCFGIVDQDKIARPINSKEGDQFDKCNVSTLQPQEKPATVMGCDLVFGIGIRKEITINSIITFLSPFGKSHAGRITASLKCLLNPKKLVAFPYHVIFMADLVPKYDLEFITFQAVCVFLNTVKRLFPTFEIILACVDDNITDDHIETISESIGIDQVKTFIAKRKRITKECAEQTAIINGTPLPAGEPIKKVFYKFCGHQEQLGGGLGEKEWITMEHLVETLWTTDTKSADTITISLVYGRTESDPEQHYHVCFKKDTIPKFDVAFHFFSSLVDFFGNLVSLFPTFPINITFVDKTKITPDMMDGLTDVIKAGRRKIASEEKSSESVTVSEPSSSTSLEAFCVWVEFISSTGRKLERKSLSAVVRSFIKAEKDVIQVHIGCPERDANFAYKCIFYNVTHMIVEKITAASIEMLEVYIRGITGKLDATFNFFLHGCLSDTEVEYLRNIVPQDIIESELLSRRSKREHATVMDLDVMGTIDGKGYTGLLKMKFIIERFNISNLVSVTIQAYRSVDYRYRVIFWDGHNGLETFVIFETIDDVRKFVRAFNIHSREGLACTYALAPCFSIKEIEALKGAVPEHQIKRALERHRSNTLRREFPAYINDSVAVSTSFEEIMSLVSASNSVSMKIKPTSYTIHTHGNKTPEVYKYCCVISDNSDDSGAMHVLFKKITDVCRFVVDLEHEKTLGFLLADITFVLGNRLIDGDVEKLVAIIPVQQIKREPKELGAVMGVSVFAALYDPLGGFHEVTELKDIFKRFCESPKVNMLFERAYTNIATPARTEYTFSYKCIIRDMVNGNGSSVLFFCVGDFNDFIGAYSKQTQGQTIFNLILHDNLTIRDIMDLQRVIPGHQYDEEMTKRQPASSCQVPEAPKDTLYNVKFNRGWEKPVQCCMDDIVSPLVKAERIFVVCCFDHTKTLKYACSIKCVGGLYSNGLVVDFANVDEMNGFIVALYGHEQLNDIDISFGFGPYMSAQDSNQISLAIIMNAKNPEPEIKKACEVLSAVFSNKPQSSTENLAQV